MGIELEGMLDTYLQYGGDSILNYLKEYPATMIDKKGNIAGYNSKDFNLDNVRTAKFIYRMNKMNHQKNIQKALKTLFTQLQHKPRTTNGVFWHKAIYANQVWLDGIFMGLPYYTLAAPKMLNTKKTEKVYADAAHQITETDKHTYDARTHLGKHAPEETHSQFWAHKDNRQNQHTWPRPHGW